MRECSSFALLEFPEGKYLQHQKAHTFSLAEAQPVKQFGTNQSRKTANRTHCFVGGPQRAFSSFCARRASKKTERVSAIRLRRCSCEAFFCPQECGTNAAACVCPGQICSAACRRCFWETLHRWRRANEQSKDPFSEEKSRAGGGGGGRSLLLLVLPRCLVSKVQAEFLEPNRRRQTRAA